MSSSSINNHTTNLIGFLTKKSLFNNNNSPNKQSPKRSSSKSSKDFKNILLSAQTRRQNKNNNKEDLSEIHLFRDHSQKEIKRNGYFGESQIQFSGKISPVRPQPNNRFSKQNNSFFETTKPSIKNPENSSIFSKSQFNQKSEKNLWLGEVSRGGSNFQVARLQSQHCLDQLSSKLHNQISSINFKMQQFNNRIGLVLSLQMKKMKQKLVSMIDQCFRQTEKNIKSYIKQQQQTLAGSMIEYRQILQRQYVKVQSLRSQMNGSNWRKAAGQLLSTQLQQKIELLLQNKDIKIQQWQYDWKDMQKKLGQVGQEIKQIVKLTYDKIK